MIDKKSCPVLLLSYLQYAGTIQGLAKSTVTNYYNDIMLFFRFYVMQHEDIRDFDIISKEMVKEIMTDEYIKKVTQDDILSFMYFLDDDRNCSIATRKRRLSALSRFYRYLKHIENVIEENPTAGIDTPEKEKRQPLFLEEKDIINLFNAIANYSNFKERDFCIVTLFLHTGLRISELASLNIPDVKADSLRIIGKGNKERLIPLDSACKYAVEQYLPTRIKPDDPKQSAALFISRKHNRMAERTIHDMIKNMCRYAGLRKGLSPHSLRHTFATLMLHDSNDIVTLQALMGHASISTTEKYVHLGNRKHSDMINNNPLNREKQFQLSDFAQDKE